MSFPTTMGKGDKTKSKPKAPAARPLADKKEAKLSSAPKLKRKPKKEEEKKEEKKAAVPEVKLVFNYSDARQGAWSGPIEPGNEQDWPVVPECTSWISCHCARGRCFGRLNTNNIVNYVPVSTISIVPWEEDPSPAPEKVEKAWKLMQEYPHACVGLTAHTDTEQKAILEAAAGLPYTSKYVLVRATADQLVLRSTADPRDIRAIGIQHAKKTETESPGGMRKALVLATLMGSLAADL